MKTIVSVFAAIVLSATAANALTLKKGEVLTNDGVMNAGETPSAIAAMDENGYHVSAGKVFIKAGDVIVDIDLRDLQGKNNKEIKEILGEEIAAELKDQLTGGFAESLSEAVERDVAAAVEQGINAVDATNLTAEQIAADIMEGNDVHHFNADPATVEAALDIVNGK